MASYSTGGMRPRRFLHVIGAGWECFWITEFPYQPRIALAFTAEFGSIDQDVLLGFEFVAKEPAGTVQHLGIADIAVPQPHGVINRNSQTALVPIDLKEPGVYELRIQSGGACFARYIF